MFIIKKKYIFLFFFFFIFIFRLFSEDIYVKDSLGFKLKLSKTNSIIKIVSLSPYITENICDLDSQDKLIGITKFCKISKLENIKDIGGMLNPNFELIFSLKPDIVFATKEDQTYETINKFKKYGIKVFVFKEVKDFKDIKDNYFTLAKILRKEKKAETNLILIDEKLKRIRLKNQKIKPLKVFFVLQENPLITVSENTFINDMLFFLNLENIVKDSNVRYPLYSKEDLIKKNPNVFLFLSKNFENKNNEYKNKDIFVLDPDIFTRATPKNFLKSVEILDKKLEGIKEKK